MVSTPVRPGARRWTPVVVRNRTDVILLGLDAIVLAVIALLVNSDESTRGRLVGIAGVLVTLLVLEMAGLYRARLTLSALDDLPRLAGWSIITSGVLFAVARPGVHITRAALYAVIVFAAAQMILSPFIVKFVHRNAEAFIGGVGLVSTFVALLLATLLGSDGIQIDGVTTWIAATVVVWLVTALATLLVPFLLVKAGVKQARENRADAQN